MSSNEEPLRPTVVIVGAGFGGLRAARRLRDSDVDVTLIDRQNFHTFLPLLYEVASAGLEPDDIAQPVRTIVRGANNTRFRLAEVQSIDLAAQRIVTDRDDVSYDYLILATGSATNFFGMHSVEERALGLKDLRQATAVRNRVLRNFECASLATDVSERRRLMTVVVVGGGPTGVELAGALAELKKHALPHDFPDLDLSEARVILLEASDRLLGPFPPKLRAKALDQLRQLGVEVRLGVSVTGAGADGVDLAGGDKIDAASVVWVAGVRGDPLGERIGAELGAGRRVKIDQMLRVPGHPNAYVIGDLACLDGPDGLPYPMLAQVAMQQGDLAALNILRDLRGEAARTFRYRDRGTMATIGRRMAVAHVFGLQLSGFVAWLMWLGVHLIALIGLRNRALVLMNWTWNYIRYDRANRIITDSPPDEPK